MEVGANGLFAPQTRLLPTAVRVYKLYLLTYLFTYSLPLTSSSSWRGTKREKTRRTI